MKSFLTAFLVLMLVGVAVSTLCTDQCGGACTINKAACDNAVVLGQLCDVSHASCTKRCGAVCGCVDGCLGQCQPGYDTCTTNAAGNPIFQVKCTVQNNICLNTCGAGCSINTGFSTMLALIRGTPGTQ